MFWVFPAALGAITNAAYFIATKRLLSRIDPMVLATGGFITAGLLLLLFASVRGIPPSGDGLLPAVAATTILNIIATILVFRTLATTDISLAVPMISYTPIFLILTSFLVLGEIPTTLGIAGICIIVIGSYVLNLSSRHTHWSEPIHAILKNRGTVTMILVAFIYAVSLNFDKIVVLESDTVFGSSLVYLALGISFLIITQARFLHINRIRQYKNWLQLEEPAPGTSQGWFLASWYADAPFFFGIGILLTLEAVSINYAFTVQITPYVIAIKRMSIILTVFYGTLIVHEGDVVRRFAGAMIMVAGAVLIILSG